MILLKMLDKLKSLYSSLTETERKLAEIYIVNLLEFKRYNKFFVKTFFREWIFEENELVIESLNEYLKTSKQKEFLHNAYTKILESFLLEENLNRESNFNPRIQIKLSIQKALIQFDYLLLKGQLKIAEEILLEKSKQALEYELYDLLVELLKKRRDKFNADFSSIDFKRLSEEIKKYSYYSTALEKVKTSFAQYRNKTFRQVDIVDYELKSALKTVSYYKNRTDSVFILSFYYLLRNDLYYQKKNWSKQNSYLIKLIELIQNRKLLYSRGRLSILYDNLSLCKLRQFDFLMGKKYKEESLQLQDGNNMNMYMVLSEKLQINLILKELESAAEIIKQLSNLKKFIKSKFYIELLQYLKSIMSIHYLEVKKSESLLSGLSELKKDKLGYNPWIRIYRILCLIELKEYEKVEKERENFRKFVERLEEGEQLSLRILTIIQFFSILRKVGYQFSHLKIRTSKELAQLSSLDEACIWNPDSPELILIHDWVWAKIERRDYAPNLGAYKKVKTK